LLDPSLEAGNGVGADLQNLDILLLEFFVVRTEPGYLILSPAGECERQKRHYGLATLETRERHFAASVRIEREIRRRGARLNRHAISPWLNDVGMSRLLAGGAAGNTCS
jgi:hypothetical protein